jgi:ATP-dependent protease ClpP protease subunit
MGPLNKITPANTEAVLIVINSYGGSIATAKNISQTLLNLRTQ